MIDTTEYEPTGAEIAAACREIQRTWSRSERRQRESGFLWTGKAGAKFNERPPVTIPTVRVHRTSGVELWD